ncbi:MAG: hypothetical protein U0984_20060 [Prosthecobacter sp.]|nr:hypothetical protein [Prosthecobacter sp.]
MNEEMQQLKAELAMTPPSHSVMQADPRVSAVELAGSHEPGAHGKDGAEARVARFCEQAFTSPESARTGSTALLQAFDDSGLWLANLVQPQQLVAELRQSCSTLTLVIVTQWTRQGETHKLARLGTALMDASPPLTTHEGGQVCALLATLLGILRPPRAQGLLEIARPLLKDSVDPHLLREAREWVNLGRILEATPPEDRFFWNRRLREPDDDWDWDTPEARGALRRLAPLLASRTQEDLSRFQSTVPPCWWDLLRDPPETFGAPHHPGYPQIVSLGQPESARLAYPGSLEPSHAGYPSYPNPSQPPYFGAADSFRFGNVRIPNFAFGLATGLSCMALVTWYVVSQAIPRTPAATPALAAAPLPQTPPPSLPQAPPTPVYAPTGLAELPAPIPQPATVAVTPVAVAETRTHVPAPAPAMIAPPDSNNPQAFRRQATMGQIIQQNPKLLRLHNLIKNGTLRENEAILNGQTTIPSFSQTDFEDLTRLLMLDAPEQPQVRMAVAKIAARTLSPAQLLSTLTLCIYPGSPNATEARQAARLALELNSEALTSADRQALEALNSPLAQNGN